MSWSFLLGFTRRLSLLPDDSLHLDIHQDIYADAGGLLPWANWAGGIDLQFQREMATLAMDSTFISSGIAAFDSDIFMGRMAKGQQRTYDGLCLCL